MPLPPFERPGPSFRQIIFHSPRDLTWGSVQIHLRWLTLQTHSLRERMKRRCRFSSLVCLPIGLIESNAEHHRGEVECVRLLVLVSRWVPWGAERVVIVVRVCSYENGLNPRRQRKSRDVIDLMNGHRELLPLLLSPGAEEPKRCGAGAWVMSDDNYS